MVESRFKFSAVESITGGIKHGFVAQWLLPGPQDGC